MNPEASNFTKDNSRDPDLYSAMVAGLEATRKYLVSVGCPHWKLAMVTFNPNDPGIEYLVVGSQGQEELEMQIEQLILRKPREFRGVAEADIKTPMMRKWASAVSDHPADIILLRLGDFYELFGDDAKLAASIMQTALTKRGGVPMCGIPYHSVDRYLELLHAAGHTTQLVG